MQVMFLGRNVVSMGLQRCDECIIVNGNSINEHAVQVKNDGLNFWVQGDVFSDRFNPQYTCRLLHRGLSRQL